MSRQTEIHNMLEAVKSDLEFIATYGDDQSLADELVDRQYHIQDIMYNIIDDLLTVI